MKKITLATILIGSILVGPYHHAYAEVTTQEATVQQEIKTEFLKEFETLEAVIEKYQEIFPDSSITSIELDKNEDKYYFKVEGQNETRDFDLKLDAKTLEVINQKEEKDDDQDIKDAIQLDGLLTHDDVCQIALKEVTHGEIVKIDLDHDDDKNETYFEIKLIEDNKEYEVRIEAYNGDILDIEVDD